MALIDNLLAYWKLDETSGNAADSHGSHTLVETVATIGTAAGKINDGRDFEAGDFARFEIADASFADFPLTAFSFSFWINLESLPYAHWLFSKWVSGGEYTFGCYIANGGYLAVFMPQSPSDTSVEMDTSYGVFAADGWHHYALVYDGSLGTGVGVKLKCYKDGSATGWSWYIEPPTSMHASTAPFEFGGRDAGWSIDGIIDEVGMWDRALTGAEVTELYNAGSGLAYPFSTGYTLPITAGSYILTGTGVGLTSQRKLPLTSGAYSLTGNPFGLLVQRLLSCTTGVYLLTGNDLALLRAANILISPGAYALTGNALSLLVSRLLSCATGVYAYSGSPLGFDNALSMSIATGSYSLTGQPISFPISRGIIIVSGSYAYNGRPITLTYTPGGAVPSDDLFDDLGPNQGLLIRSNN